MKLEIWKKKNQNIFSLWLPVVWFVQTGQKNTAVWTWEYSDASTFLNKAELNLFIYLNL